MGADLHALDADRREFLDDPIPFLREYGAPPSIDVTLLRDSRRSFGYPFELLYEDRLEPPEALALTEHLELVYRDGNLISGLSLRTLQTIVWIRTWAGEHESPIGGIH